MRSVQAPISLCLACSSSLPPARASSSTFYTSCCSRPICPNCLAANPRLARYNPCLRCLAGVNAVNSFFSHGTPSGLHDTDPLVRMNIDGSVRDEDIFVVEDDDDSDIESETDAIEAQAEDRPPSPIPSPPSSDPPVPNKILLHSPFLKSQAHSTPNPETGTERAEDIQTEPGNPPKYYISPDDTLLGISLKLGIDSRILCRLNNLPPSTLRTTPHLLHTRSFLILPRSSRSPLPPTPAQLALDEERKARLAIERAETRFQAMTKETDRDVAKAYVALAGVPEDSADVKEYAKEKEQDDGLRIPRTTQTDADTPGRSSLEGRAMDQYFEDEEWEAHEHVEGRKVTIQSFPYFAGSKTAAGKLPVAGEGKPWWRWRP